MNTLRPPSLATIAAGATLVTAVAWWLPASTPAGLAWGAGVLGGLLLLLGLFPLLARLTEVREGADAADRIETPVASDLQSSGRIVQEDDDELDPGAPWDAGATLDPGATFDPGDPLETRRGLAARHPSGAK